LDGCFVSSKPARIERLLSFDQIRENGINQSKATDPIGASLTSSEWGEWKVGDLSSLRCGLLLLLSCCDRGSD
jgi:hypothetical protein